MTLTPPSETRATGLHLVLGPPNAGKLGFVLGWWEDLKGAVPLVVVPSLGDAQHVRSELLERVPVVLDDRPVCTFDTLAALISPDLPPLLGDVQRSLILTDILTRDWEGPLKGLARHPGALMAIAALVDELGETGQPKSAVREALARSIAAPGGGLFADLLLLLDRYEEAVHARGLVDRHEALALAARSSGDWRRPLAFHGFFSFTAAQRRLVLRMADVVPVLVTLAVCPDRVIVDHAAEEAERLRPMARSVTEMPRQRIVFSSPAIAHLERSFLVDGYEPMRDPAEDAPPVDTDGSASVTTRRLEGVRFLLSAGRRHEAEAVAAEIVALMRDGVRPGDIAVLVRDMGPWQRLLGEVFGRFRVPHTIDGLAEFGATGLGHTLVRALRGVIRQDLDDLLVYLRTPYHPMPLGRVDDAEVLLRRRAGLEGPDVLRGLDEVLPGGLDQVREAFVWRDGSPVGFSRDGLARLAGEMVVSAAGGRGGGSPSLEQDALALRALRRALAAWDTAGPQGEPTGGSAVVDRLSGSVDMGLDILASVSVASGSGTSADTVTVSTVRRARARRFTVVFVMGLVDGEFPGSRPPPGLLAYRERARLRTESGEPLLAPEPSPDDASLFALALSRPWQLLYLSARDAEDDGSEILPSPFWTEARRLLSAGAAVPRRSLADVVFSPGNAPTPREFLRACAAQGLTPSEPGEAALLERLPPWQCRPERLSDSGLLGALAARERFSATEIEAYVGCPYRWYVDRVVGLNTLEETLGGLEAGSVVHRVLSEIYEEIRARGHVRVDPDNLSEVLAMLPGALERATSDLRGGFDEGEERLFLWDVEKRVRWLLRFDAESGSELTVTELEASLPAEGVPLGGFSLTGRIDRMDEDRETGALVVVDYKYGSSLATRDFAKKGVLQVPLYVLALRSCRPGRDVAGGVYAALGAGEVRGAVLEEVAARGGRWTAKCAVDETRLESELDDVLAAARTAVEGIRAGRIDGRPLRECPRFCDLRPLCRAPGRRSAW